VRGANSSLGHPFKREPRPPAKNLKYVRDFKFTLIAEGKYLSVSLPRPPVGGGAPLEGVPTAVRTLFPWMENLRGHPLLAFEERYPAHVG
jgi:hypothetical protein